MNQDLAISTEQQTTELPTESQLTLSLNDHEAMELTRCESVIDEGIAVFVQVGNALYTIRESRLYRDTHATFEDYTSERFHMGKSGAYRLINAAEVYHQLEAVSPIGDTGEHLLPANEAQARPLSSLPKEQRVEAWEQAKERAGGQPTAAVVQEVVDEMLPPKAIKEPDVPAALAPLFEIAEDAGKQSRFVSPDPAPINAQGDKPKPDDMTDEEWEASAKPILEKPGGEEPDAGSTVFAESPQAASSPGVAAPTETGTDGTGNALGENRAADVDAPVSAPKPAVGQVGKPSASAAPAPAAVPVAPALPAGFTTAIVKEEDYKKAMERGLWPLSQVLETFTELEENVKFLEAGELYKALVEASPSVPLYPPPSQAMVVAGVSATRLAEINQTSGGSVLYHSETQLLDELFADRETTGADHIVAVLVTARMREMTAKMAEETN